MNVVFWVIAVLLSIIMIQISLFTFHFFQPPMDVLDLSIETPIVKFGESVTVNQEYNRRDYCKVEIDRFILNTDTRLLVRRERLPAGVLPVGVGVVRTAIPTKLPPNTVIALGIADPAMGDLVPGKYTLTEMLHYTCENRASNTVAAPARRFEVIP